jgi:hypothetical protein
MGLNPSGQSWSTSLHNHAPRIAAKDLFVVPTIGFFQLYILVIIRLVRRELALLNVTRHPRAEWIAQYQQLPPRPSHFKYRVAARIHNAR